MSGAVSALADQIAAYRPLLYRLALSQLGDKAAADEVTQEALLAALEAAPRFENRGSLKAWLFAILRHKIIDTIRSRSRRPVLSGQIEDELDLRSFDALFDGEGCWAAPKDAWSDPETAVEQIAFFKVLEFCLTRLPPRTARAFLMREWLDLTPDDISAELSITAGNLRVLLYRARMQLRLCLDKGWDRS